DRGDRPAEGHRLPDDARVAAQAIAPERIADDYLPPVQVRLRIRRVLRPGGRDAAEQRLAPEDAKEVPGDDRARHALQRSVGRPNDEAPRLVDGGGLEAAPVKLPVV